MADHALGVMAPLAVAAEALAGFVCPLTTWENQLRHMAGGAERYEGSFVQHWLHQVMFFDLGESVFTVIYIVFFTVVALSLWFVPPHRPRRDAGRIKQSAKPSEPRT